MKRVLYCLFPIFMMLGAVSAEAQTTDGKEFWLTFGKNWRTNQNDGVLELQIRIVSRNLPASGTIHFTELGTTKTFNLGAWDVFNYSLSPTEISAVYNGVQGTNNKSIHIKSNDNAVTAYALNQYRLSADATNLLPVTAYDYEYYHISYIPRSSDENDAYAVIAIENGTQVYHNNGSTPVATLNAGQVYYRTSATDMTGARVVADKPVAFFALNQGVFIPIGLTGASADVLMQQLAPVNTWGKRFFVPVSNVAVNTKERVRIVASQDGTTFVTPPTGVLVITGTGGQPNLANPLNAGQFFELEIYLANSGCYFEMDKPVGVCTYLTSAAYNNGGTNPHSDPSQAWLPAIEQSANDALITPFLPTGITELKDHFALIMTSTDAQNDTEVSIGGATPVGLTGGTWHDNAAAGMSFYSMPLDGNTSTSYRFINDAGIIVMGYGYGWAESYYYLGYSSMRNLAAAFFANDVHYQDWGNTLFCVHDITITADIEEINDNAGSLQWYIDGVLQPDLEDQDVWTENFPAGEYEIKMWVLFADGTSNNFISILRVGANIETDVSPLPGGSVIGDGCYEVGEEVELTAIPNAPTYKFSHWTKGDDPTPISEDNPYKFPAAESELWIAHFVWDIFPVTLIAKPQANNEVKGAGFYAHGEEATIEAIADACHTFINWTAFDEFGNEVEISTNPIEYITVLSDTTLTANFSQNIHEITLHADPDVGGTVQGEEIDIPCGELRTITATPDDCYTFKHWEDPNGNIISTKAIFTFPVMSDTILTAIFEIKMFNVILVAIPDDVGIVEGAGVYKCGDVVTINAYSEDDCYKFVKWTENGVLFSENAEETITVMGHRVLIAHFEKLIYMITAEPYPTEGGEVKGDGSYFCELTASLEAKPTEGWDFIDWTENGLTVETEAVYSFPATGDRHLVANFVQRSYDITVLAEPITGGVALLSGTHPHGMILTVNAIAFIPCNKFKYWTRDGEIISYNPDYT
ncbi:MAG: hypothetical protein FWF09_06705, partial [Bacteroidales bacterium]|nr:hypothetical protein [Bacteroidales bacterium]